MLKHNIKRNKYNAKKTECDGITFDSQAECRWYQKLKELQASGDVTMFLRQPMFDLPGSVKYRADFLVFWDNGTVSIWDVKGFDKEKNFIAKKKMVEALYPIKIEVIK